jgi:hypothetical protein
MAEALQQRIAVLEKKVGSGGKSPLFAQLASFYIQEGRANDALRLCDEGLAVFPHYTTGHLVKGKALLALKMNAEAKREFEIVHNFLPANETVSFILTNIRAEDRETLTAPASDGLVFEPSTERRIVARKIPLDVSPAEANRLIGEEEEAPAQEAVAPEPSPAPPIEAIPQPTSVFDALISTPPPAPTEVEDPFGFAGSTPGTETPGAAETPIAEAETSVFGDFPSQPEQTFVGFAETGASPAANVFDFPSQPQEPGIAVPGEESFEAYSVRMRGELVGENTISLEDHLNSPLVEAMPEPPLPVSEPTPAIDQIENLTEKLQTAKKITPVINLATKSTTTASEADTPASTGFVTPTLAEIYAKQGWFDDAIKAYRTLCITKPAEKERFEKRIVELEEQKKQQPK